MILSAADRLHVELTRVVQRNCHIADARHAADLTLCIYLLQMREYFRWERGLPFGATLPQAEVGQWIAAREQPVGRLWRSRTSACCRWATAPACRPVRRGRRSTPAAAHTFGLVYAAGRPRGPGLCSSWPTPCLRPAAREEPAGDAWPAASWARGLADAAPAVLDTRARRAHHHRAARGPGALVLGALRGLLAAAWRRQRRSRRRAAYGLDQDLHAVWPAVWTTSVERCCCTNRASTVRVNCWAGLVDHCGWPAHRRGELAARAVRDQLADLALTVPTLLDRAQPARCTPGSPPTKAGASSCFRAGSSLRPLARRARAGFALRRLPGQRTSWRWRGRGLALHACGARRRQALMLSPQAVCTADSAERASGQSRSACQA
jgi:hypothetical protein